MAYLPSGSLRLGRLLRRMLALTHNPSVGIKKDAELVPVVDVTPELIDTGFEYVALTAGGAGATGWGNIGVPENEVWEILACSFYTNGVPTANAVSIQDTASGDAFNAYFAATTGVALDVLKGVYLKAGSQIQLIVSGACNPSLYLAVRKIPV